MSYLASIRSTLDGSDKSMEYEYDSVQAKVAGAIGAFNVSDDVEVGVEVGNPWHWDRIDKDVKVEETKKLKPAKGKNPTKSTPSLISPSLNPFMSMFSYDPTVSTKGVIMRPESVGSQMLSQDENYANEVRIGRGSFMGGRMAGYDDEDARDDDKSDEMEGAKGAFSRLETI